MQVLPSSVLVQARVHFYLYLIKLSNRYSLIKTVSTVLTNSLAALLVQLEHFFVQVVLCHY